MFLVKWNLVNQLIIHSIGHATKNGIIAKCSHYHNNGLLFKNSLFFALVYRSCLVTIGERSYQVKHGETHFDKCNCRSCVCYFGRIYCEEPQDVCRRAKCADEPQAADCALNNGTVVLHGQTIIQDCNKYNIKTL